jgi:hypothetical protein
MDRRQARRNGTNSRCPLRCLPVRIPWRNPVRIALTGNAAQRALITWHYGWEPALRASGIARGPGWTEPVLGQLLDDPYAAIRCLAERSLKQSGGTPPAGYQYTVGLQSAAPEPATRCGASGCSESNLIRRQPLLN